MPRPSALILGVALVLCGPASEACGPDFPWQLLSNRTATLRATPANGFTYEATRLVVPGDTVLRAVEEDGRRVPSGEDPHTIGLSEAEAALVRTLREAESGEDVLKHLEDTTVVLPTAVRLYEVGAIHFRAGTNIAAAAEFAKVLALPVPDRSPRATWAAYMLGRTRARLGDRAGAAAAFRQTRVEALAGAPDPLGLAVASYGEEARLHLALANGLIEGDDPPTDRDVAEGGPAVARAIVLYAEQAARGSRSGLASLRWLSGRLLMMPERAAAVVADPLAQRLLVSYALARISDLPHEDKRVDAAEGRPGVRVNPILTALVQAVERTGQGTVPGADRLAALAYRTGRFALAIRLTAHASGPVAAWVRGKLALRRGDREGAARAYAEAARVFPINEANLDGEAAVRLIGEDAVLRLSRGDYHDALTRLYPFSSTYWGDVAHLAERVLTASELRAFVDRVATVTPPSTPAGWGRDYRQRLRTLLARRLVREGHAGESLAYFDAEQQERVQAYRTALRAARDAKRSTFEQAAAWYEAGLLARNDGLTMLGYEGPPDYAVTEGAFGFGYGQTQVAGMFVPSIEKARFAATAARPDRRYHYRYVAVNHLVHAVNLIPRDAPAVPALLCLAAEWMRATPSGTDWLRQTYASYVGPHGLAPWTPQSGEHCEKPEFVEPSAAPIR